MHSEQFKTNRRLAGSGKSRRSSREVPTNTRPFTGQYTRFYISSFVIRRVTNAWLTHTTHSPSPLGAWDRAFCYSLPGSISHKADHPWSEASGRGVPWSALASDARPSRSASGTGACDTSRPPRAGVFVNLEPLIGAILGVFLLHEVPSGGLVLGGTSILAGALIISWPRSIGMAAA